MITCGSNALGSGYRVSLQENLDDNENITKKEIHLLVVLSGPKSRLMAWNRMARFLEHRIKSFIEIVADSSGSSSSVFLS